jgi:transcriptional regulator with XRE-family HTH domain
MAERMSIGNMREVEINMEAVGMAKKKRRLLRDVLPGVAGPSDLGRRLGISRQHASLLWNGRIVPSLQMIQLIHARLGVPLEVLATVQRATPPRKRGPKLTDEGEG